MKGSDEIMQKQPKHFLVFKIIGIFGVVVAVIGFLNIITGFGDFSTNNFFAGMFMLPIGSFIGFSCLMIGFRPEISKIATKTAKYIQEENKEDLKDIVSTSAEITSEAITTTAKAVKKGFRGTMFCKFCGKEIDEDSKFCRHCGEEL